MFLLNAFYSEHQEKSFMSHILFAFQDTKLGENLRGGQLAAEFLSKYVTEKSCRILDVGAGSGYAGKEVSRLNFLFTSDF